MEIFELKTLEPGGRVSVDELDRHSARIRFRYCSVIFFAFLLILFIIHKLGPEFASPQLRTGILQFGHALIKTFSVTPQCHNVREQKTAAILARVSFDDELLGLRLRG